MAYKILAPPPIVVVVCLEYPLPLARHLSVMLKHVLASLNTGGFITLCLPCFLTLLYGDEAGTAPLLRLSSDLVGCRWMSSVGGPYVCT